MKLFLIRHTTVDVAQGTCYGQSDVPPADVFEAEKEKILLQLKDKHFDRIISSPLGRCVVLAKTIAKKENTIEYDARLMELNFGDWEGKCWKDIEQSNSAKKWFADVVNQQCPNGESYSRMIERVREFIDELQKDKQTKQVALVCHAGVIRAFYVVLHNTPPKATFNIPIGYGQIVEMNLA